MEKQLISWGSVGLVERVIRVFEQGLLVASETDTVIGLLAPMTLSGYECLNAAKARTGKHYLVLAAHREQVDGLVVLPEDAALQRLLATCWPGPLTLICPVREAIRERLPSSYTTLGVRIPDHAGLQGLIASCGPLFSTSANVAGDPVPAFLDQLDAHLNRQVGLLIQGAGQARTVPSTILEIRNERVVLVREGAYPWALIQDIVHT